MVEANYFSKGLPNVARIRAYQIELSIKGLGWPGNKQVAIDLDLDPIKGRQQVATSVALIRKEKGERPTPQETKDIRKRVESQARGGHKFLFKKFADMGMASPEIQAVMRDRGFNFEAQSISSVVAKARRLGDYRQLTDAEIANIRKTTDKRTPRSKIWGRARLWERLITELDLVGKTVPQDRIEWMSILATPPKRLHDVLNTYTGEIGLIIRDTKGRIIIDPTTDTVTLQFPTLPPKVVRSPRSLIGSKYLFI